MTCALQRAPCKSISPTCTPQPPLLPGCAPPPLTPSHSIISVVFWFSRSNSVRNWNHMMSSWTRGFVVAKSVTGTRYQQYVALRNHLNIACCAVCDLVKKLACIKSAQGFRFKLFPVFRHADRRRSESQHLLYKRLDRCTKIRLDQRPRSFFLDDALGSVF